MIQRGHEYLHWEGEGRHLDANGVLHGYYPDDKDYYPSQFPFYSFEYTSSPAYAKYVTKHPPHRLHTKFHPRYTDINTGKVVEADIVKYYDDGQVKRDHFDVVKILEYDGVTSKYKVEYLVDTGKQMAEPYRTHSLTREFLERVGHVLHKSTMNQMGGKFYKKHNRKPSKRKTRRN